MKKHLIKLSLLSCFGILLLAGRALYTSDTIFLFLIWNLLLAWIPLFLTLYLSKLEKPGYWTLIIIASLWLLFLPNAPYLITDLKHLKHSTLGYSWVDPLIFFTFSFVGIYSALLSTTLVHQALCKIMHNLVSWFLIVACFVLSGFGVYLGRVQRFNSWDIFTHPFRLMRLSIHSLQNTQAQAMTISFAIFMLLAYGLFIHSTDLKLENEKKPA